MEAMGGDPLLLALVDRQAVPWVRTAHDRTKAREARLRACRPFDKLSPSAWLRIDVPLVGIESAEFLAQSGYLTGGSRLARQCN